MSLLDKLRRDIRPKIALPPLHEDPHEAEKLNRARWQSGLLGTLLYGYQRGLYAFFHQHLSDEEALLATALCARRFGKTSVALVVQMERCIWHEGYKALYVTKTGKQARLIVIPAMRALLKTCPAELRPRFDKMDSVLHYANGSTLQLIGLDNDREDEVRGIASDLTVADETAYWDRAESQLNNAVFPPLMTTNGKCLMVTTPSSEPGHYVETLVQESARDRKLYYADYTVYVEHYGQKRMDEFARLAGGYHSETFRREYKCEFVRDPSRVVFSNFEPEKCTPGSLRLTPPVHFETLPRFIGMDHGVTHASAVVAGRYDMETKRFWIDGEMVWRKSDVTTAQMAADITILERRLYERATGPMLRIVDNASAQLILDLTQQFGLPCMPCDKKDGLHGMLERTGRWLAEGRIILDPEICPQLIADLHRVRWEKNRRKLAESFGGAGHSDLTMALVYVVNRLAKYEAAEMPAVSEDLSLWPGHLRAAVRKRSGFDKLASLWSN